MPERTLYAEWRAENSPNKYPFSDSATLENREGDTIPPETFIDAALYPVGGGPNLRLSKVVVDFPAATIYIGDTANDELAHGELDLWDVPDVVALEDQYGRPAGVLVSEAKFLNVFQSWSLGTHEFTAAQTEFAATVCMPTPEIGLRGFLLDSGELVTGEVKFLGTDGVVLQTSTEVVQTPCGGTETYEVIRVDVVGDPLFRRRECTPGGQFNTPKFIKTVTFESSLGSFAVSPGDYGGLLMSVGNSLASDTILRIRTLSDEIVIETVGQPLAGGRS